jgi:hypothetical protein
MKQLFKVIFFALICIIYVIAFAILRNLEINGRPIITAGMFMSVCILYYYLFQKKKDKSDDTK